MCRQSISKRWPQAQQSQANHVSYSWLLASLLIWLLHNSVVLLIFMYVCHDNYTNFFFSDYNHWSLGGLNYMTASLIWKNHIYTLIRKSVRNMSLLCTEISKNNIFVKHCISYPYTVHKVYKVLTLWTGS